MLFPVLETEDIVQVGDQTRLSAIKSFVSKGESAIAKVEIQPESGGDWFNVTGSGPKDWFLDWQYAGDTRDIVPSVRVSIAEPAEDEDSDNEDDESPEDEATEHKLTAIAGAMKIISKADDKLFSADTDLIALEPDVLKYVIQGRSSFLNVHRAAQKKILESLDESGVVDKSGHKLTKAAVVDVSEVAAWSRDLTLHLIFKSLILSADDVFESKMKFYSKEVVSRTERAILRLDLNGNGTIETREGVAQMSAALVRR